MPLEGATKSTLLWASDKSCYTTRVEGGVVWCGPCDTLLKASATRCSAVCFYGVVWCVPCDTLLKASATRCSAVCLCGVVWLGVVQVLRHSALGKCHEHTALGLV